MSRRFHGFYSAAWNAVFPRRKGEGKSTATGLRSLALSLFAALLLPLAALAITPDEQLDDPALEARARAISKTLRCIICQSQSIDESNVSLAQDLRRLVRERLVAGDTDEAVYDRVVQSYGDYVLLKPPVRGRTMLLWAGPALFLLFGGGLAAVVVRQAMRTPVPEDETDAEPQSGPEARA
jgi:cytochrome c-type biogenesis protein CcmH